MSISDKIYLQTLTNSIAVIYSQFPGYIYKDFPKVSDDITTLVIAITFITNPVSSKL